MGGSRAVDVGIARNTEIVLDLKMESAVGCGHCYAIENGFGFENDDDGSALLAMVTAMRSKIRLVWKTDRAVGYGHCYEIENSCGLENGWRCWLWSLLENPKMGMRCWLWSLL